MSTTERLVVSIDDGALARAVQQIAAERQQPIGEAVVEALRLWLERQEGEDDLAAVAEAEGDPTVPWERVEAMKQATRVPR